MILIKLLFGFLIPLAKITFLLYLIFTRVKDLSYHRNCCYVAIAFFILTLMDSLIGSFSYFGVIIWGLLAYLYTKKYREYNDKDYYSNNHYR